MAPGNCKFQNMQACCAQSTIANKVIRAPSAHFYPWPSNLHKESNKTWTQPVFRVSHTPWAFQIKVTVTFVKRDRRYFNKNY